MTCYYIKYLKYKSKYIKISSKLHNNLTQKNCDGTINLNNPNQIKFIKNNPEKNLQKIEKILGNNFTINYNIDDSLIHGWRKLNTDDFSFTTLYHIV
jgi:hypothetical protein